MSPACPCCGLPTLSARAAFEICPVCWWEDDGQNDADADARSGGPNGAPTLTRARANWQALGWCGHPEDDPCGRTEGQRALRCLAEARRDGGPRDAAALAAALKTARNGMGQA